MGNPAASLIETSEEATSERTLIAVGSRALGAVQRLRLGSVSINALRTARGPVLVAPQVAPQGAPHSPRIVARRGGSRARGGIGDKAEPGA